MKISTVAMAAGLGQVSATYFHNAPAFNCPGNSNNHCLDSYRTGLNWQDLAPGNFDKYKGFNWKGFQAVDKFSKRSELGRRNFQDKAIAGKAYKTRDQSPQMSCDAAAGNEKTSIKEFQIETAFDCDLEFHYGMPDGSVCKSRHRCEQAGTTVPNNQCGGATDVTIVYPHQPEIPHDGCDFAIPSIGFDCDNNTPSSTPPVVKPPQSTTYPGAPPPAGTPPAGTPPAGTPPAGTPPAGTPPAGTPPANTYPGGTPPAGTPPAGTPPAGTPPAGTPPANTYPAGTPPAGTPPQTTSSSSPGQSTPVVSVPSDTYSGSVPTTLSTRSSSGPSSAPSDTYSASVPAITSSSVVGTTASSSVPGNTYPIIVPSGSSSVPAGTPSNSESVPVGGTTTYSGSVPSQSVPVGGATTSSSSSPETTTNSGSVPSQSVPGQSSSSTQPASGTESVPATYPAGGPSSTVTKPGNTNSAPAPPQETLPCPGVVPSCLNTWMFVVKCIDNTDSSCYCPDEKFVKNVFECMYAHGETDDIIQEAVQYFQGICAPYVPQNPAIGTGANTITQVITPTATAPPAQTYTTIQVIATTVIPCTDAQGAVIPSSSSTVTVSQTISVPEVHFSTITNLPGTTAVGIVPGPTVYPTATAPQGVPATGTTYGPYPTGGAGQSTTMITTRPGGTGSASYPTGKPTIPVAGATRFSAGIAGMVAIIAFVL